ncbi:hypothetical protein ACFLRS_00320 [Campylobacterota bacterium]
MTIADIEFEMNINNVTEKDISEIIEICKKSGFILESIDDELQKRGYTKIFTVDYDDVNDDDVYDDEWED